MRIDRDVETRQAAGSRHQKQEAGRRPKLDHLAHDFSGIELAQLAKSPHPAEQRGRYTERDHIRERVQFASKVAAGASHARDESIHTVEKYCEADGLGGIVKVPGLGGAGMGDLQNRVVSEGDVRGGE